MAEETRRDEIGRNWSVGIRRTREGRRERERSRESLEDRG